MLRALAALSVMALSFASTASAQRDLIEEGVAHYEAGELAEADEALRNALDGGTLSRADLVEILTHQVLIARALSDRAALETAAVRLMSLEPRALDDQAPPDLAAELERARERTHGRLRVEVFHEEDESGVHVQARVAADAGGLVREVELRARVVGSPWPVDAGTAVFLEGASASEVEVAARAIGPGGSILATHGTEAEPTLLSVSTGDVEEVDSGEVEDEGGGSGVLIGVLVGVAAALVAGGVILGVVLATQDQGESRVSSFGVSW